jgi:hypothetical protein
VGEDDFTKRLEAIETLVRLNALIAEMHAAIDRLHAMTVASVRDAEQPFRQAAASAALTREEWSWRAYGDARAQMKTLLAPLEDDLSAQAVNED